MNQLAAALREAVPPAAQGWVLEVGTGSGRTTRPLVAAGVTLWGVDKSRDKLRSLARDWPGRWVQADATRLAFPAASFGAIITVRVMHLVRQPEQALREFKRLLRPGGVYLRGGKRVEPDSFWQQLREQWTAWLAERGIPQRHNGFTDQMLRERLFELGATCQSTMVQEEQVETCAADEIAYLMDRTAAGAWQAPAGLIPEATAAMRTWACAQLGSLTRPVSYQAVWFLDRWQFS